MPFIKDTIFVKYKIPHALYQLDDYSKENQQALRTELK
jgi:hypothetical protein